MNNNSRRENVRKQKRRPRSQSMSTLLAITSICSLLLFTTFQQVLRDIWGLQGFYYVCVRSFTGTTFLRPSSDPATETSPIIERSRIDVIFDFTKVRVEEPSDLVEGDRVHPAMKIILTSPGNPYQLLWLHRSCVRIFAGLTRVNLISVYEKSRTSRDGVEIAKKKYRSLGT